MTFSKEMTEAITSELSSGRVSGPEDRNKRNSLVKEKIPSAKKRPADELIESLEFELLKGKNVIEECDPEEESPSNARTPLPSKKESASLLT